MNFKLTKKLVNSVSFGLILLSGFYLLSRVHNAFHNPEPATGQSFTYILLLFIMVIAFAQFLLNLTLPDEKQFITATESPNVKSGRKEEIETETKKTEEDNEKIKTSSLNTKEILERIIPNKLPTVEEYGETILNNLANEIEIVQGILYVKNLSENTFSSVSFYAYFSSEKPKDFKEGETLPGQVAKNKDLLVVDNIPDNYIKVVSGLGERSPNFLILVPIIHNDESIAIIEMATFKRYDENYTNLLKSMGNKIATTMFNYVKRTENIKNDKKE